MDIGEYWWICDWSNPNYVIIISLRKKIVARLFFDTKTLFAGLVLEKWCRGWATCNIRRLCFGNFVLDFEFSSFFFYSTDVISMVPAQMPTIIVLATFWDDFHSEVRTILIAITWEIFAPKLISGIPGWQIIMSSIVSRMYMKRFSKLLRTQYRMFQRLWHRVSRPLLKWLGASQSHLQISMLELMLNQCFDWKPWIWQGRKFLIQK